MLLIHGTSTVVTVALYARAWVEIVGQGEKGVGEMSPSMRRAWVEII